MRTPPENKVLPAAALYRAILGGLCRDQFSKLALACVLLILSSICALAAPLFIKEIIDRAVPALDFALVLYYSFWTILLNTAGFIFWGLHYDYSITASENIFLRLRKKIFSGIMRKRLDFFSSHLSGDILTRMMGDMDIVSAFFRDAVLRALALSLTSLLLIAGLVALNWQMGTVFLLGLPLLIVYIKKVYEPVSARFRKTRDALTCQNDTLLDLLGGIREIRFFQQNERAAARFSEDTRKYTDMNIKSLLRFNWVYLGMDFLSETVRLLPFIIGALLLCRGTEGITVGLLMAYYIIFFRVATQVSIVFQCVISSAQALPSLQRLKEVVDFPEEEQGAELGIDDVPERTDIEFRSVSFSYPHSGEIFEGLNFQVAPGEKVAVMGASGSGKSTLAKLLVRFLKPSGGEIFFGGKKVEDYPLSFYLSYFAYVGQDTHLFRESFRDNISMGWYGVPVDRIREVAQLAGINEFIEKLSRGYDTIFGEGGLNLSGGQKQRVALARALIRDPQVLVLDEFTSGLDPATEKEVLDDIFRVFKDQTIVCITHKQSVAARFDRVFRIPGQNAAAADGAAAG